MRLRIPFKWEVAGLANFAWLSSSMIIPTMRFVVEGGEPVAERIRRGEGQILLTWHGRTLLPMYYYRNLGFCAMISPSRDGEIQDRIFRRYGWTSVRGSTGRGALKAALACIRFLEEGRTLALAPDGPKGPSRVVQPGAVYMALRSGVPIIPAGVAASPGWNMPSWDRYLVPLPFSRGAIVFGSQVYVDPETGEEEQAAISRCLGERIDELERRAEEITRTRHRALAGL